ncbi:thymidine phosphorylase, partial [Burkholderia pseudomallei]|nr:thymidine phosphorylase [Burkholderia pseudomallei]MDV2183137.1 thymidine phosphorylase [Burkholderia pseudomallei]
RHLPRAAAAAPVAAARAGWIERIDARALGLAVVGLGGGRAKIGDTLDYSVGLSALAELGERVEAGQPLATVHARDADSAAQATDAVRRAYRIGAEPPAQTRVVHAVIE